jgi:adenylate cyclase class IV
MVDPGPDAMEPTVDIRNIEIKLRIDDAAAAREAIARLADGPPQRLEQIDTYFDAGPDALLKLRREARDGGDWSASLIAYRRSLADDPQPSDIRLVRIDDGDGLHDALAHALPVAALVRKCRELSFSGQTRIHLDDIEGLGPYVELEVVLRDGQSENEGRSIADSLIERLGLGGAQPQHASYRDLVAGPADWQRR